MKHTDRKHSKILYNRIVELENSLNFVKTTLYDNPFFLVAPGTEKIQSEWKTVLSGYNDISTNEIEKLIDFGFTIIDRDYLEEKTVTDIFSPLKIKERYILLDKEYGLALLPNNPFKKNFYFGMSELKRYGETYPALQSNISNIFSIGALRAHSIQNQKFGHSPIELEVNSRYDLDKFILNLQSKIKKQNSRFQIWYRGQNKEYLLPKIEKKLLDHIPWRNFIDPSLVPSIFRNSEKIQNNLDVYVQKLEETFSLEVGLNSKLNIPRFQKRNDSKEKIKQYFSGTVWEDSNSPFSFTHTDGKDFNEIHDYNPVYRGLQTSLFLQHYGVETNILDITKDIDVALFFAQNRNENGQYHKMEKVDSSVLYIFLLDPRTDRFIDSTELLESYEIKRPLRQKCGVLAGASYSNQNYYSKFISIRVKFNEQIPYNSEFSPHFLFPPNEEDEILTFLQNYTKENNHQFIKPF